MFAYKSHDKASVQCRFVLSHGMLHLNVAFNSAIDRSAVSGAFLFVVTVLFAVTQMDILEISTILPSPSGFT